MWYYSYFSFAARNYINTVWYLESCWCCRGSVPTAALNLWVCLHLRICRGRRVAKVTWVWFCTCAQVFTRLIITPYKISKETLFIFINTCPLLHEFPTAAPSCWHWLNQVYLTCWSLNINTILFKISLIPTESLIINKIDWLFRRKLMVSSSASNIYDKTLYWGDSAHCLWVAELV